MTVARPAYIDITNRIPRVKVETIGTRSRGEIEHQVGHYEAGGFISPNLTQEQEIAHLVDVALFHHRRDFGGATGRTLEYTYALLPSGRIYLVNPETSIVWSHRNGNRVGMSTLLCLGVGQEPTAAMLGTLRDHWDYTASRADMRVARPRSWGHGECGLIYGGGPAWGNNTDCPGRALPWIREYRKGAIVPEPVGNTQFFPETGHNISNAFLDFWKANGGLEEFGFPLSEERSASEHPYSHLGELAGYTVQLFERKALAWKAGSPVVVVRLGALLLAADGDSAHGCACEAHE